MKAKLPLSLSISILLGITPIVLFAQNPKYNVLFVAVDDMNERTSFFGYPEVATPNVQRLLNRGMLFTKAYAQYALCNPSRTSFLSGWRPDKTQVFDMATRPRSVISPTVKFLPEYFKQLGYHTERYGKIMHITYENDITWDYAEPPEIGSSSSITLRSDIDGEEIMAAAFQYPVGTWWVSRDNDSVTYDGIFAKDLVKRLQQPQIQPFFYGLGLVSPHDAFTPTLKNWNLNGDPFVQELLPINGAGDTMAGFVGNGSSNMVIPNEPTDDLSDIPIAAFSSTPLKKEPDELKRTIHAYDGEVSMMDAQLGLVLDELDRQNLWANTIVVFFSDHGQHFGEHQGLWRKQTLFEESLHVPLIVCMPGKPAGICNKLVELVDVYPTLIELCGLPPVSGIEGSSFARLLDNPEQPWKRAVFSQVQRNDTVAGRGVTTERYRYNYWGNSGEELYDHSNDPKEYTNQVGNPAYTTVLADMRTIRTEGWTKSLPPPCDTVTYYKDVDGDGYGTTADSVRACYRPIGYSPGKNDCNDNNAALNPGIAEICDGVDNNCNGQVDETCRPVMSINDKGEVEGNSGRKTMKFTVVLNHPYVDKVSVRVATVNNTATDGSDYAGGSGTFTFLPGQALKHVSVSIFGDYLPESNESFKVLLSKSVNATIADSLAIGVIRNDDTILSEIQKIDTITSNEAVSITKTNVKVWPNPVANFINVQLIPLAINISSIQLTNIEGDVLREWKFSPSVKRSVEQLHIAGIVNGFYLLVIKDDKGHKHNKKIVISH